MPSTDPPTGTPRPDLRERLAAARLYMVCGADPDGSELPTLLRAASAGGVEIVQLREKHLPDEELASIAIAMRILCEQLGTLLIVNDRPWVAREAEADGVHVGQDDIPVSELRELVGPDMLIGLSTHTPEQIDAVDASVVDYIGVGPIHQTPTKPGRPAVGVELIRYAAARAPVPFFAIGGLDANNLPQALDAGATRVCVLRAIAAAADPQRAAQELREQLDARLVES
ncbi:MAG TPA: thiamine phosphate synthase [Solirubrobacteraceae bacterium]|jgi:thiamine-phosphate pyrophosphorylase|nr:thiamine phosphate synthase [Solirubrobacteraceae bacterium]